MNISCSNKPESIATAKAIIKMEPDTLERVISGKDSQVKAAFQKAQNEGIKAAKKTQEAIPMCLPLPIDGIKIGLTPKSNNIIEIETTITTKTERTSAKMEALSAASMTAFVFRELCQKIDHSIEVSNVEVVDSVA